ncbi:MAG: response regulator transcription factor [Dehalococcoidia bacterium]|nr:MAG: response regulator transcription factor [Dehalococcoidia bacterium]
MRKIVAMIVSNDAFSRAGIRETLSGQNALALLEIVECDPGEDGNEAVKQILESSPDVVVLDLGHISTRGLEVSRKLTRNFPGTRVIVLSSKSTEDDDELFEVMKTGAVAYLRSKQCTPNTLVEIIERATNGEYPINDEIFDRPQLSARVLRQFQDIAAAGRPLGEVAMSLTARESQVLTLIADGNSNKLIAGILGTSEQTVKNHVSTILRKLNANDRAHAVFIAVRDGLISVESNTNAGQVGEGGILDSNYLGNRRRGAPASRMTLRQYLRGRSPTS